MGVLLDEGIEADLKNLTWCVLDRIWLLGLVSPLVSTLLPESPPAMLCLALGSPTSEEHGPAGATPEEALEML